MSIPFPIPISRVFAGVLWWLSVFPVLAAVRIDFSHSYTGAASANQNTGNITLAFAVDGAGNVTLDASCADPDPAAYVNEFDGPVGTVSDPAMWGRSFSIILSSTGSGALRVDNTGGGLAVQGGNAQLIDADGSGVKEVITATVAATGTEFRLQGLGYAGLLGGAGMNVSGAIYPLSGGSGTADVSAQGVAGTFTISSSASVAGQGFVLKGMSFDLVGIPPQPGTSSFDNGAGDKLWTTAANWNPNGVPVSPTGAEITGFDVVLDTALAFSPAELKIINGSLTLTGSGALSIRTMTIGRNHEKVVRLVIDGSGVSFGCSGSSASDQFAVGTAATVETKPDAGGCAPLELGAATLVLDLGSQWILDGSNFIGPYHIGDRFVLANFGSFSGSTMGVRVRNFDLPPDRRLSLVKTAASLYYEVVAQAPATGPNIIIINTDDMAGGQHFHFEGRDCLTPTIDTLASTGIRFTAAFAASTVCGPSRYSLLTGRWPSRNTSANYISTYPLGTLGRFGVSDTELEDDRQNIGALLQQAGYRTGMVGKSHLTDDDLVSTDNWPSKGLLTYPQTDDPRLNATTNGKMRHNHRVVAQRMRTFGFDYVESYYMANLAELRNDALNVHNQEWITKGALDFIEENHGERFFLYMAPTINHGPVRNDLTKTLRADPRYTSAGYLPDEDYSFMPARQAIIDQVTAAGKDPISARETWLDYSIAAILNKLTQHGIRNDTLIIFTSDHGEKTLYGPLVWGKSSLYDLGMRVPLVLNWPNGIAAPGRAYGEIVSHVDLAPTLLALTGASGLPTRPMDGISLLPVLNGGSAKVRDDVFCEIGYARAVRTKDRKYIAVRYTPQVYAQIASGYLWPAYATGLPTEPRPYYLNNSQLGSQAAATNANYFADDQLFNLTIDPTEQSNLYGQEPATAYDLKKRLANYIGGIPGRPFRGFGDSSTEFSPAPAAAPAAPGALQVQFLTPHSVKLDWTDTATSELGYVVRETLDGGPSRIIAELPSGATTYTAALDPGIEDIVLEVAGYNAVGDTPVTADLLAPESWRHRTFGDIDPTLSLPVSQWVNDADNDGESTLWEYACGTNPRLGSSVARAVGSINRTGPAPFLELLVPRDRRRSVQITGCVSTDLWSWQSGPPYCVLVEDEDDHLLFRSATPADDQPRQFIRAAITGP